MRVGGGSTARVGAGARDEPIDPLVALMMALDRALAPRPEVKLLGWL